MRCAICNRTTDKPAVWIGSNPIGPQCAKKRGLLPPMQPRLQRNQQAQDDDTPDLFGAQPTMVIMGIDPGTSTGIAIIIDGVLHSLQTVEPYNIEATMLDVMPHRVIFEDSRLQSHQWTQSTNRAAALKMARNVGEVDAWCKLIVAVCDKHKITSHGISPKNKGAKMDAQSFAKMTGWTERSNQHERDAAQVAWPYRLAK